MFTDNGEAVSQAAVTHLQSALELFAKCIETMEPDKLLRLAEHQSKGATMSARVIGPSNGEPPKAAIGLWHPEAGWLEMCAFAMPVPTQH
jgi:hypothetical protein